MKTHQGLFDSQQELAHDWARGLTKDYPKAGEEEELAELLRGALRQESKGFELTVAYLRAGFLVTLLLFSLGSLFLPRVVDLEGYPVALAIVVATCLVASFAFAMVLRSGWYHPLVRKIAPIIDGVMIVVIFGLLYYNTTAVWQRAPIGMVALTATACGFLAFSGALRLSRSSGRFATAAASVAWIGTALIVQLPPFETVLIGLTILAIGLMSARLTRTIQRGISNQIIMLRYGMLYDDAQQAITAREDMLKIVSHDLRNPLSTIGMTADLIRDVQLPESERNRYLDMISRAGESMNRLIQDYLDVTRIKQGGIPVDLVPAKLSDIVDQTLDTMAPLAARSNVALESQLPADLPNVKADPDRIVQLFSNLIGNALKFTPAGGAIWIRAERAGDKVRVSVRDTGPGIPVEQLNNIFVSLWQAKRGDRRGIGYGLKIVRGIVEAHGERLGVESSPGAGAEFWFTLSIADDVKSR